MIENNLTIKKGEFIEKASALIYSLSDSLVECDFLISTNTNAIITEMKEMRENSNLLSVAICDFLCDLYEDENKSKNIELDL